MAISKPTSSKTLHFKNGGTVSSMPLPPKGFDPRKADPRKLIQYGYPKRPDGHPELMAVWERSILGVRRVPLTFSVPVGPRSTTVDGGFSAPAAAPHFAGTSVGPAFGYDLAWVAAEMTVPNLYPRGASGGAMGALVAITNGSSALFSSSGVSAGLQMSVQASETPWAASQSCYFSGQVMGAYNDPLIPDGFFFAGSDDAGPDAIRAGDLVSTMICLVDPTSAIIFYSNLTSGVGGSALVRTPSARAVSGNVAHWHIERTGTSPTDGLFFPVPHFGRVFFSNAMAFAQAADSGDFLAGRLLNSGDSEPIHMVDNSDRSKVLVSARSVDSRTIEFSSNR